MEEDERDSYYLQDDLGSPMQLMDEEGESRETYGFDEFGRNLDHRPEKQIQPFGYTGYQLEAAGGLYFAQARRYDANNGRFISEDKISGFTPAPYSLNRYSYCWNQPMEHVDLNGEFPWILIPLVAVAVFVVVGLTGCGNNSTSESTNVISETVSEFSISEVPTEAPANDSTQQNSDSNNYLNLTEEEKIFVATVCGESIGEGELGWRAVANVIMNRESSNHFPNTVTEIIQKKYAFDAYESQSPEYKKAMDYLNNRTYDNELYEEVISIILPIYRREDLNDITQGATLYFSPKSMSTPNAIPPWNYDLLEEIYVDGLDSHSFRFYRYLDECVD